MPRLDADRDYARRFIARHQAKVDRSGGLLACWPWTGATNPDGYGTLRGGRQHVSDTGIHSSYRAHRVALAIATCPPDMTLFQFMRAGQWSQGIADLDAAHVCPGMPCRACCNPLHLDWKTHQHNMWDTLARFGQLGRPARA